MLRLQSRHYWQFLLNLPSRIFKTPKCLILPPYSSVASLLVLLAGLWEEELNFTFAGSCYQATMLIQCYLEKGGAENSSFRHRDKLVALFSCSLPLHHPVHCWVEEKTLPFSDWREAPWQFLDTGNVLAQAVLRPVWKPH